MAFVSVRDDVGVIGTKLGCVSDGLWAFGFVLDYFRFTLKGVLDYLGMAWVIVGEQ